MWGEQALEGEGLAFAHGEGGTFAELGVFEEDRALEVVVSLGFGRSLGGWLLFTVREHSRGPEVTLGK